MKDKKKSLAIIILIIGVVTLIIGVVFLAVRLNAGPAVSDAEYLVEKGNWEMEPLNCPESEVIRDGCGEAGVIWKFTEVGKGTLTTNNHQNDYDFIWAIEDGKLKIETSWLYTLNDEFNYKLDKGSGTLTLTRDGSGDINFRATSGVDTEVTQGN